jgi:hypothetical protein
MNLAVIQFLRQLALSRDKIKDYIDKDKKECIFSFLLI